MGDTVDEIIGKLAEHADIDKDQAVNLIYKNDESEQIQMELVINSIAEAFDFNDECKRNKWK